MEGFNSRFDNYNYNLVSMVTYRYSYDVTASIHTQGEWGF